MKDATHYANSIAKRENEDSLERVRTSDNSKIITLTSSERQAWKRALLPVHRQFGDKIGKELIEEIYQLTGFDPATL